jgi:GTP:adenosylcobinamide-phosphate guanylyltransferase
MRIPAVVMAGDRRAARAVQGESKVYLKLGGRALVAHAVATLQRVPEVSEVWVVGNAERLEAVLGAEELRRELRKPLTLVPQFRNLYENAWQTYRRLLPGAGPEGRDPGDDDLPVLYLSADLPFATPQEISEFVRRSTAADCDYAIGLVTAESMQEFAPEGPQLPGIRMACFNLREGRFRQSNLHFVRPARLGNRHYVEEMYEHRYQRELRDIVALAWRILRSEHGGLRVLWYYALMHVAGLADRWGLRGLADRLRRSLPLARIEAAVSGLLRTRMRFVVTEAGGCAIDIDNDEDWVVARQRFEAWRRRQEARAEKLYGAIPLPERASAGPPIAPRRVPGGES